MSRTISGEEYYRKHELVLPWAIANIHNVGAREGQEDSFGISDIRDNKNGIMFVLADGMGGMSNGKLISDTVVSFMLKSFKEIENYKEVTDFLIDKTNEINEKINELNMNNISSGGSTLIVAIIQDDKLYYCSVGDSKICMLKDNKLEQINKEHNYAQTLKKLVQMGELTQEEANSNKHKHALTSYIGMESELKIDVSTKPIMLGSSDKVIIMSDGIFNTMPLDEIELYMQEDVYSAAAGIESKILSERRKFQDNFTAIIIQSNY